MLRAQLANEFHQMGQKAKSNITFQILVAKALWKLITLPKIWKLLLMASHQDFHYNLAEDWLHKDE